MKLPDFDELMPTAQMDAIMNAQAYVSFEESSAGRNVAVLEQQLKELHDLNDKLRDECARHEAAKAREAKLKPLYTILSAFVGAVLTLLFEHIMDIIAFIGSLIH